MVGNRPFTVDGMLKVAIVDHDAFAREALRELLGRQSDLAVVAECADGDAAVAAIRRMKPDIVVLDVNIPGTNGFEVLDAVHSDCTPAVIFVTANDQHAIRAFEAGALDYIVKPVSATRFQSALNRARKRAVAESATVVQQIKEWVNANGHRRSSAQRLPLRSEGRILLVEVNEIRCIESAGNYLKIHLRSESHMVRDTLIAFEARLDPEQFVRIHRSTIVNRRHVKELIPSSTGDYTVVTDDGKQLTLSRTYRARVEQLTETDTDRRL